MGVSLPPHEQVHPPKKASPLLHLSLLHCTHGGNSVCYKMSHKCQTFHIHLGVRIVEKVSSAYKGGAETKTAGQSGLHLEMEMEHI